MSNQYRESITGLGLTQLFSDTWTGVLKSQTIAISYEIVADYSQAYNSLKSAIKTIILFLTINILTIICPLLISDLIVLCFGSLGVVLSYKQGVLDAVEQYEALNTLITADTWALSYVATYFQACVRVLAQEVPLVAKDVYSLHATWPMRRGTSIYENALCLFLAALSSCVTYVLVLQPLLVLRLFIAKHYAAKVVVIPAACVVMLTMFATTSAAVGAVQSRRLKRGGVGGGGEKGAAEANVNQRALIMTFGSSDIYNVTVEFVTNMLLQNCSFNPTQVYELKWDSKDVVNRPTKQRVLQMIEWLVNDCAPEDRLFLYMAGLSHPDHVLCQRGEYVTYQEIRSTLVSNVPAGAVVHIFSEGSTAQGVLQLPYILTQDPYEQFWFKPKGREGMTTPAVFIQFHCDTSVPYHVHSGVSYSSTTRGTKLTDRLVSLMAAQQTTLTYKHLAFVLQFGRATGQKYISRKTMQAYRKIYDAASALTGAEGGGGGWEDDVFRVESRRLAVTVQCTAKIDLSAQVVF